jgi:hypothetical protein
MKDTQRLIVSILLNNVEVEIGELAHNGRKIFFST